MPLDDNEDGELPHKSPSRNTSNQAPAQALPQTSAPASAPAQDTLGPAPPVTPRTRRVSSFTTPTTGAAPRTSGSRTGSRTASRTGQHASGGQSSRRRPSAAEYEAYYFGSASPAHVRHFSAAHGLPQFRNRLAALSLTASGHNTRFLGQHGGESKERPGSMASAGAGTTKAPGLEYGDTQNKPVPITPTNFVVFDIGNRSIRAGFAGDAEPRCVVPVDFAWNRVSQTPSNCFPYNHYPNETDPHTDTFGIHDASAQEYSQDAIDSDEEDLDSLFDDTAGLPDEYRHTLWRMREVGVVRPTDADGTHGIGASGGAWYRTHPRQRLEALLEILVRHIFSQELLVNPRAQRVVVVENPLWQVSIKHSIANVFLKHLRTASLSFFPGPVLSLVAAGARSGVVVDLGWEETCVAPVCDLRLLAPAVASTTRASRRLHALVAQTLCAHAIVVPNQLPGPLPQCVTPGLVSFDAVEKIIAQCLYEHHDTPVVAPTKSSKEVAALQFIRINKDTVIAIEAERLQHALSSCFFTNSPPTLHKQQQQSTLSPTPSTVSFFSQPSSISYSQSQQQQQQQQAPKRYDDLDDTDIATLVARVLAALPLDAKSSAQSHIVFTGAAAAIPGLRSRLLQDLRRKVAHMGAGAMSPLYISGSDSLGAWAGASIYLSSLAWFFAQDTPVSSNPSHTGPAPVGGPKNKLPGEMTRDAYLTHGYHKLNPPYGLVV